MSVLCLCSSSKPLLRSLFLKIETTIFPFLSKITKPVPMDNNNGKITNTIENEK